MFISSFRKPHALGENGEKKRGKKIINAFPKANQSTGESEHSRPPILSLLYGPIKQHLRSFDPDDLPRRRFNGLLVGNQRVGKEFAECDGLFRTKDVRNARITCDGVRTHLILPTCCYIRHNDIEVLKSTNNYLFVAVKGHDYGRSETTEVNVSSNLFSTV